MHTVHPNVNRLHSPVQETAVWRLLLNILFLKGSLTYDPGNVTKPRSPLQLCLLVNYLIVVEEESRQHLWVEGSVCTGLFKRIENSTLICKIFQRREIRFKAWDLKHEDIFVVCLFVT